MRLPWVLVCSIAIVACQPQVVYSICATKAPSNDMLNGASFLAKLAPTVKTSVSKVADKFPYRTPSLLLA
jgi:hypothetical protein